MTSIGRPLVFGVPTNRAVLALMPLGALVNAATGFSASAPPLAVAGDALTGLLVVFGAWALTRELAPDDDPAAFVAVLLAFVALIAFGEVSLLLLFTTMFLVRIVNRTTGLGPRVHDSALVLVLALAAAWSLSVPLLALVAAAAFGADAKLSGGRALQLVPAAIAAAAFPVMVFGPQAASMAISLTTDRTSAVLLVIAIAYLAVTVSTGPVRSTGDATGETLNTRRVRTGMLIGLLVPVVTYVSSPGGAGLAPLLWACVSAVVLSRVARQVSDRPGRADGG